MYSSSKQKFNYLIDEIDRVGLEIEDEDIYDFWERVRDMNDLIS